MIPCRIPTYAIAYVCNSLFQGSQLSTVLYGLTSCISITSNEVCKNSESSDTTWPVYAVMSRSERYFGNTVVQALFVLAQIWRHKRCVSVDYRQLAVILRQVASLLICQSLYQKKVLQWHVCEFLGMQTSNMRGKLPIGMAAVARN